MKVKNSQELLFSQKPGGSLLVKKLSFHKNFFSLICTKILILDTLSVPVFLDFQSVLSKGIILKALFEYLQTSINQQILPKTCEKNVSKCSCVQVEIE